MNVATPPPPPRPDRMTWRSAVRTVRHLTLSMSSVSKVFWAIFLLTIENKMKSCGPQIHLSSPAYLANCNPTNSNTHTCRWRWTLLAKRSIDVPVHSWPHCNGNSVYIFLFWELHGFSPNFHIHVSVSDLYIPRIGQHISSCRKGRPRGNIYFAHGHMNVEIGTDTPIFLFWQYLFQIFSFKVSIFGILSLQCITSGR